MKQSNVQILVTVLVTAVIVGGSVSWAVFTAPQEDEEISFTGKVTGKSAYNQPKLDLPAQEIFSRDIELGSLFTITTSDATYNDAVFVKGYLGVFMFDIFVNVETDGFASIGCVGKLITADEGSEVTITYSGTSERYSHTPHYNQGDSKNRQDYDSDEQFANFYMVKGGDIKDGVLYRSYSPFNDPSKEPRSTYVNQLAEKAGINYDIALSYTPQKIQKIVETLDGYCVDLCKNGNYDAPDMTYLYFQLKERLIEVLKAIMDNDGPYLIHCNAGRDRTGFVVLLLQSLCGCSAEQMAVDEAMAFSNLYRIDKGTLEFTYVVKNTYDRNMYLMANYDQIPNIFEIDWNHIDVTKVDTQKAAHDFCTDYLGLTEGEVSKLVDRLCK